MIWRLRHEWRLNAAKRRGTRLSWRWSIPTKARPPKARAALREVMLDLIRDDEAAKASETAHAKIKDA